MAFALDAGASIVVPQVNTVEEAKRIVAGAKYGTKYRGARSAPPYRFVPDLTDTCYDKSMSLYENMNEQAAIIIQIESLEGINNLDAILTEVPEIDCVWIGTLDTRVSMGLPMSVGSRAPSPNAFKEEEWIAAMKTYKAALEKHNKPHSGLVFGDLETRMEKSKGMSFMIPCADVVSIMGTMSVLAEARKIYPALGSK
jgi:4-hydroxy-2-oxoheptanedioate aldolase